ncbi:MAG: DUF4180 domain-containing protein [Clostridiales bacterium]|nr:DUF4180 domain-containing protein [Clostridiales bacterium]
MEIRFLDVKGVRVAEVLGEPHSLKGMDMVKDLIGSLVFEHKVSRLLIHRDFIDESFFDLKTGFAGELAQAFTNYRLKLAVVGDFNLLASLALKACIRESNLGQTAYFTKDRQNALAWLAG